jgi:hypothetical protein
VDAALQKTGQADLYVSGLQPWHTMLELGLTTFAETPEPTRSDAHAWSASPNYSFLAIVCGIQPAEKGFRSVLIEPALGNLDWIGGTKPHQLGDIRLDLRKTDSGGLSGSVTLPEGLTGTFRWGGSIIELPSGQTDISLWFQGPAVTTLLAVDLGAESGRVVRGEFAGDVLRLSEVSRFPRE